jgi:hypothetical protein
MWMDDKGKKSRLSAPQYVDYVMTYVQKTANDEAIFPTKVRIRFEFAEQRIHKYVRKIRRSVNG